MPPHTEPASSASLRVRPPLEPPSFQEILATRERIADSITRTPLLRLEVDTPAEIFLKLENLQPMGSFKLRGALSAMRSVPREQLAQGVYTASAGNMAQGLAWAAREMGIVCRVIVPETAPRTKIEAVERLGGTLIPVPFDVWWKALSEHGYPGMPGLFVHTGADPAVIAGNATIGLEIAEDLPNVDTVITPYGSGGLSFGVALGLRGARSSASVFAAEVETSAPLRASLAAGRPMTVDRVPSFVDGISPRSVLDEMWPMARSLLAGTAVSTLAEIAAAIRTLVIRAHVVAEGAGAAPVAAALTGRVPGKRIVCVVSGGNLDPDKLAVILAGGVPG